MSITETRQDGVELKWRETSVVIRYHGKLRGGKILKNWLVFDGKFRSGMWIDDIPDAPVVLSTQYIVAANLEAWYGSRWYA